MYKERQKNKVLGNEGEKNTERISRGTNKMHANALGRQAGRQAAKSLGANKALKCSVQLEKRQSTFPTPVTKEQTKENKQLKATLQSHNRCTPS